MTCIRSRTWKFSTSVAGISVLLLTLGLICGPQKVRANLVSGIKILAKHLDADLIDRWPGALDSAKPKRDSAVAIDAAGVVSHFGVTHAQTEAEVASTAFTAAVLNLGDGLGKTLFEAEYGSPFQPDSIVALMRHTLQNDYAGSTAGRLLDSASGAVAAGHDGNPGGRLDLRGVNSPSASALSFKSIQDSTVHNLTPLDAAGREPRPGPTPPQKVLSTVQKPKADNQTVGGFGRDRSRDDSSPGPEQKSAADVGKPEATPVAAALYHGNSSLFDSAGWRPGETLRHELMAVDGSDHSTDTLVPTPALLGAPLPPVWPGSLLTGENLVGGAANDGEGPNDADLRDFNAGDTPAAQFQMEDQTFGPTPVVIPEPDSLILLGPVLILIGGILLAAIRVQK